jgi:hypothetical protein
MNLPKLYVSPEQHEFENQDSLREWLEETDEKTLVRPAASVDEILLNYDGKTKEGEYRYTATAFQAVASALSPGLSSLIPNLAGVEPRSRRKEEVISFRGAVDIFNIVVGMRFSAELSHCQFVFNSREKLVEGVLGPKTKYLENSLLLQLVDDMLASTYGTDVSFYRAFVFGRRLILRYIDQEVFWVAGPRGDKSYDIHQGFHFSNSESGDASVRAAPAYLNKDLSTASLGRFARAKTRMIHVGRDFHSRLADLLSAVITHEGDKDGILSSLEFIYSASLNFEPSDRDDFDKQLSELAGDLARFDGITQNLGQRVVERAAYMGAFPTDDLKYKSIRNSQIVERTKYDVYEAILLEAKKLPVRQREAAERSAFDYLVSSTN